MSKGKLIVVEGIDGSGKTTIVDHIEKELKASNVPLLRVKEPGSTPVGEHLREMLLNHNSDLSSWTEVNILLASKSQLFNKKILPALNNGINVLMDRFNHSLLAYQGAIRKIRCDDLITILDIMKLNIEPDLLVYLNIDKGTQITRLGIIRDRMDVLAMHNYNILNKGYKLADCYLKSKSKVDIDAGQALDVVCSQTMAAINETIIREDYADLT